MKYTNEMKIFNNFKSSKLDIELTINDILKMINKYKQEIVPVLNINEDLITQDMDWGLTQFDGRKSNGSFMGIESNSNLADVIHVNINSYSTASAPTYTLNTTDGSSDELEVYDAIYKANNGKSKDEEIADSVGVFGVTYEIVNYIDKDNIRFVRVDPRGCFIIQSEELEPRTIAGVRFIKTWDNKDIVELYGETIYRKWVGGDGSGYNLVEEKQNVIGICPVIQYRNNKYCKSDAAPAFSTLKDITLTLTTSSDLTHYMAQPILALYGLDVENDDYQEMVRKGVVALEDDSARIEFIKKPEATEQLKFHWDLLMDTLFRDTFCPRLDSSGDISKVASSKTLQFLYIATSASVQRKVSCITKALKERIKIIFAYLNYTKVSSNDMLDYSLIDIKFTPNLPTITSSTIEELVQLASLGVLSEETLLEIIPNQYVSDVAKELERKAKEKATYENVYTFDETPDNANDDSQDGDEDEDD